MSTSKKHRNFVSEPMGRKNVTELAGVGETLGSRLSSKGYTKASHVYGKYLSMDQNKEQFQNWMRGNAGANAKQSSDCYNSLREWTKEFL